MNSTFSFFNIFLSIISSRNPDCPHILYNEDIAASCCQKEIIELHTRQRAIVTPWSVPDVPKMAWDGELAKIAQDIAGKCKFKYQQVEDRRFQIEQNMYLKCSKSDDIQGNWLEPIIYWFGVDKVRPNYAASRGETGQATWRKLQALQVGCGYANYKIKENDFSVGKGVGINLSDTKKDFCQLYVCVYGSL